MLKKIDVKQLREGMYIHELCSAWLDTPFWQKSFLLGDRQSLDKIRKSAIHAVWIDTGRGLDVLCEKEDGDTDTLNAQKQFLSPSR